MIKMLRRHDADVYLWFLFWNYDTNLWFGVVFMTFYWWQRKLYILLSHPPLIIVFNLILDSEMPLYAVEQHRIIDSLGLVWGGNRSVLHVYGEYMFLNVVDQWHRQRISSQNAIGVPNFEKFWIVYQLRPVLWLIF